CQDCSHYNTPGVVRRKSSCHRVSTLVSRSPSSSETLQQPGWSVGSPRKRQPCKLKVAPSISSTRCRSSGCTRSCGLPLNNGSCCNNCWICLISAELSTVGV